MDINKMLTICSSHTKNSTLKTLHSESIKKTTETKSFPCFDVYTKTSIGVKTKTEYFIHINIDEFKNYICWYHNMPKDLATVVAFAIDVGCDILHLSEYGNELLSLPRYYYHEEMGENNTKKEYERCYNCQGLVYTKELL